MVFRIHRFFFVVGAGYCLIFSIINYPNSNPYVPDKVLSIRQALRIEAKKSRVIIYPGRLSIQVK